MKRIGCVILAGLVVGFGCATRTGPPSAGNVEKARVYYEQGVSLTQEERFRDALSAFKKAVDLYPEYGDAYYNMGIAYHRLDRIEDAIGAYQKAIDIDPKDVTARNNLGNLYVRQGALSAAIRELEQAVRIDPTYGAAHHNLALAYYLARMYHRAKDHLDQLEVLGLTPDADLVKAVDTALSPGKEAE